MKRSNADNWFSKCIRKRDNYTCQKCGKQYPHNSSGLHCSHHWSRRHRTIRWCADNAIALCHSCHEWFGGNPIESGFWLADKLGEEMTDLLAEKKNSRVKVSKLEEKDIASHYREQFKLMEENPNHKLISWQ